jgi:hypothetical protein
MNVRDYLVRGRPLRITEYAPVVFNNLRLRLGFNNQILSQSLSPLNNLEIVNFTSPNPGGASQSFLTSLGDTRFMIKTINKQEKDIFLKMLREYYYRIRNDPFSRLVRILGLYSIGCNSTFIILMENVVQFPQQAYIFDLKGSSFNRRVLTSEVIEAPRGSVMKDLDFKSLDFMLYVEHDTANQLKKSIKKDVSLLKRYGIMDYSLLLAIYDTEPESSNRYSIKSSSDYTYSLGIIDIFQQFNFRKKTEAEFKKVISSERASSIDPISYARRFLEFVSNDLFASNSSIYTLY